MLLQKYLEVHGLSQAYRERYVRYRWRDIVGDVLCKRTRVRGLAKKTLYLQVLSGPLRYELRHREKSIIALIEDKVGKGVVEKIVYR